MSAPVRLGKGENKTSTDKLLDKLEDLLLEYALVLLPLGLTGALILFAFILASSCGLSAVESGSLRNFLVTGV